MTDDITRNIITSIFPKKARHWLGAAIGFGVLAAIVGGIVSVTGALNLGARAPHAPGVAHLLHGTFKRSVAARAAEVPDSVNLDDPALILGGAGHYANVCANCHGAPGLGQSPIALSMRPEPPTIINAADRYEAGELFRILDGGVRLSGMPAWPVSDRPDEVWAMVAFLEQLPDMSHGDYIQLAYGDSPKGESYTRRVTRTEAEDDPTGTRPYLPGDPQSVFATDDGTLLPAVGFLETRTSADITDTCARCHGTDGAGRDGGYFPNLTLLSPEYLESQLRAFATGERQSAIMWTVAANLSNDDLLSVAEHYGSMPARASLGQAPAADASLIATGEEIAAVGIPDDTAGQIADGEPVPTTVQSCNGCHVTLAADTGTIPGLAGQNAHYLKTQMELFRDGIWQVNPMQSVSHNLDDLDIDALAAYYASLPPEKAPN